MSMPKGIGKKNQIFSAVKKKITVRRSILGGQKITQARARRLWTQF
jgi:hypothetical protein